MEIDPLFASAHADLIYELEGKGFQEDEDGVWSGIIVHADGRSWPTKIDMRGPYSGYPTYPPSVKRTDRAPLTWHQNPDGSMCLYSQSQPGQFPWFLHGDLLNKATNWLVQADANWSKEIRPDLDLERYWRRSSRYELIIPGRPCGRGRAQVPAGPRPGHPVPSRDSASTGKALKEAQEHLRSRHRCGAVVHAATELGRSAQPDPKARTS